jgi:hypothetical protein
MTATSASCCPSVRLSWFRFANQLTVSSDCHFADREPRPQCGLRIKVEDFRPYARKRPEHLDAGFVAGYDRKQGYPDFTEDVAVLQAHGIGPGSTVVDLGAGTGRSRSTA